MTLYNIVHNKIRYREAAHSVKSPLKLMFVAQKPLEPSESLKQLI